MRGEDRPLSTRLQGGLRFFRHPLPTPPSARLATGLPHARDVMGLPCFTQVTWDDLAPAYYTGSPFSPCATLRSWATDYMSFGSSLSASLACQSLRCLKQFTWVGLVIQPEPPTALTLAVAEASSRLPPGPKAEGCCHGSFRPDRYQSRRRRSSFFSNPAK